MAYRPRRGVVAVLLALLAAACSTGVGAITELPADGLATTTTTETTTSASPETTATTNVSVSSSTAPDPREFDAEVGVPEQGGPFPAVVLVHGGGWVTGNPSIMRPLADHLNAHGYLTVNTRYTLAGLDRPGFPSAVEDVACAVRFAATHPDSDGSVAVVGFSAGAHIGALVALTGDSYSEGCSYQGSGLPERFVGLAGPYDVSRLGPAIGAFFGEGPDLIPEAWEAGNPQLQVEANPELSSLIMYGENDGLVTEGFAFAFHQALVDSGGDSLLELVEGARHNDMHDPDLVGDLIVTWLSRATS
jgi:acetyl esterase/lipase